MEIFSGLANSDLWIIYLISLIVLPFLVILQRPLVLIMFEPSIAATQGIWVKSLSYLLMGFLVLSMIASLQAVGVILALGMLIAPAATVYLCSDSFSAMFWGGGLIGMIGSCAGLFVSYCLNLPSGACIVLTLGVIFFLAYLFSPKYGTLPKLLRRRQHLHGTSVVG